MLGSKIKELRRQRHLNQDKFAQMLGVSRSTLSRWERNEAVPDSEQLTQIADAFQISIRYLIDDQMSHEDISKDTGTVSNEEIVQQLIRINDNFAEELARRKDTVKRVTLIILIIIFVISMMFAILIINNMYTPGQGYDKDTVYYYVQSQNDGGNHDQKDNSDC